MTCEVKPKIEAILLDANALKKKIPNLSHLMSEWSQLALIHGDPEQTYTINFQFMSPADIQELNLQFRQKDKPTNVLTFPFNEPFNPRDPFVGDIAICTDILQQEAEQENKSLQDHLAHLVIHSVLHCQGYDHQNDQEANEMETTEISLLGQCGIKTHTYKLRTISN